MGSLSWGHWNELQWDWVPQITHCLWRPWTVVGASGRLKGRLSKGNRLGNTCNCSTEPSWWSVCQTWKADAVPAGKSSTGNVEDIFTCNTERHGLQGGMPTQTTLTVSPPPQNMEAKHHPKKWLHSKISSTEQGSCRIFLRLTKEITHGFSAQLKGRFKVILDGYYSYLYSHAYN